MGAAAAALEKDPRNAKAAYRRAQALMEVATFPPPGSKSSAAAKAAKLAVEAAELAASLEAKDAKVAEMLDNAKAKAAELGPPPLRRKRNWALLKRLRNW